MYVIYLTCCVLDHPPPPWLNRSSPSRPHPRGRHYPTIDRRRPSGRKKTSVRIYLSDYDFQPINQLAVEACIYFEVKIPIVLALQRITILCSKYSVWNKNYNNVFDIKKNRLLNLIIKIPTRNIDYNTVKIVQ